MIDENEYYIMPYMKFINVFSICFQKIGKTIHVNKVSFLNDKEKEAYYNIECNDICFEFKGFIVEKNDLNECSKIKTRSHEYNNELIAIKKERLINWENYVIYKYGELNSVGEKDKIKCAMNNVIERLLSNEKNMSIQNLEKKIKKLESKIREEKIKLLDMKTELEFLKASDREL